MLMQHLQVSAQSPIAIYNEQSDKASKHLTGGAHLELPRWAQESHPAWSPFLANHGDMHRLAGKPTS